MLGIFLGSLDQRIEPLALEESVPFPDTVVAQIPPVLELRENAKGANDSEVYTIVGDVVEKRSVPFNSTSQPKKGGNQSQNTKPANEQTINENDKQQMEATGNQKRGQKGKMKKIKEKYKDQDDDERDLKMKLLQV